MVRNKSQGQNGLNGNRLENQGDNRQDAKTPNRELDRDEQLRESGRKNGKGGNTRKGSPGKDNH